MIVTLSDGVNGTTMYNVVGDEVDQAGSWKEVGVSVRAYKFIYTMYTSLDFCSFAFAPSYTATILLGSTFTRRNTVSSRTNGRLLSSSWETNRGKPNPSASGSVDGRWKFSHVGSGTNDSATPPWPPPPLPSVPCSNSVKVTEWENGHLSRASYSPGSTLMYTDTCVPSPGPLPLRNIDACSL